MLSIPFKRNDSKLIAKRIARLPTAAEMAKDRHVLPPEEYAVAEAERILAAALSAEGE